MVDRRTNEAELYLELLKGIKEDVHKLQEGIPLHEDHHKFIASMIKREEERSTFRRAVIEKTTASLLWSLILFLIAAVGAWFKGYFK